MDNKNTIKDHLDTSFDYDGIVVSKELLQKTMAAIKADEEDRKEQENNKQQSWTKKPRYIRRYIHSLGVAAAAVVLLIGATQVFRSSKKSVAPNHMNESSLMQDDQTGAYESSQDINDGTSEAKREQENGMHIQSDDLAKKDSSDEMPMLSHNFPLAGIEVIRLTMESEEVLREIEDKEIIAEVMQLINEAVIVREAESDFDYGSNGGREEEAKGEEETDNQARMYHMILLSDTNESFDVLIGNQIQIRRVGEIEYKEYGMDEVKSQESNLLEKLDEILEGDR